MSAPQDTFTELTAHLWRGGTVANWFTSTPQANGKERKRTIWFDVERPKPYPSGKTNVWFGLAPLRQIPPTNAKGEPTRPAHVRSQLDYLSAVNCLFAEYDRKDYPEGALPHIIALPLQPSVLIESSPGSYHAYWLLADTFRLDTPADLERAKAAQAGWVNAVGGDKGAKDLTRVLRIPGTLNVKPKYAPDFPTVKVIYAHFDRLYTFEQLEAIALPALTEAEQARAARARSGQPAHVVDFGEQMDPPDLADLPPDLADLLNNPRADDRSRHDYRVCCRLISLGYSDGQVKAIYDHCPVGQQGKYSERGLDYLVRTLSRAREVTPDPTLGTGVPVKDLLNIARKWAYSGDCIEYLREKGIRRPADAAKVLAGTVLTAREYHALTFMPGLRKVAEYAGVGHKTVDRQHAALAAAGVIQRQKQPTGWLLSLSFVTMLAPSLCVSDTPITTTVNTVSLTHSEEWHENNLQNDLFVAVPYRYGIKRRTMPTVLLQSLGAAALSVWRELLAAGEATAQELADATGLSADGVKRVLHKMVSASLVYVVRKAGKRHADVWALVDDSEERAAIILPETTGYGTGVRNAELADRLQASWIENKLDDAEQARREGDDTPEKAREIDKLKRAIVARRKRADLRAAQLEAMGVKPAKHYRPQTFMRWDLAEQEQEHAAALQAWMELADLPTAERAQKMHMAGWTQADISTAVKLVWRHSPVGVASV